MWPFDTLASDRCLVKLKTGDAHPVRLSAHWRDLLKTQESLSPLDIADLQGITCSRVRQILRLGRLAPEIRNTLLEMDDEKLKEFGEKRLRAMIPLEKREQLQRFVNMLPEFRFNPAENRSNPEELE